MRPVAPADGVGAAHTIDTRVPQPPRTVLQVVREMVLVLPHLAVLLARLLRDPLVPRRRKMFVALAVAYVASPIDLVPDVLPVVGQLDDAIFVAFAVHHLLDGAPPAVRAEYWAGSEDALDLVAALLAWGAEMVPEPIRRLVEG